MSEGRFLSGSTMGHVARMTLTGALGISFVFLVDAVNLFWLAQFGTPQLVAAIGFAFAIQYFSVSSGIGLMIAANVLVSRAIGAGDRGMARTQAGSAMAIAFAVQSLMAATIVIFRHDLVAMAGATGETAILAARYLAISVPSLGVMVVAMVANAVLRAEGDAARSMYVTLISGGVALIIDPPLIYYFGLDGAATGLVISRCIMLAVALRFAIGTHDLVARPALRSILLCLTPFAFVAGPAILTQMATPVGNYLLTTVMAQFGDDAVAGWAVVGRLTVLAFGGIFSLSGAIAGIFGQNYGGKRWERLRMAYRDALIFGVGYSIVMWGLLVACLPLIKTAFALQPGGEIVLDAFIYIGAGAVVCAAALFVSNAAFNALGKPGRSTFVNWLRDGILTLPLALWGAAAFGAPGVIYAQALAGALVGLGSAIWGWYFVQRLTASQDSTLDAAPART
ncbi:MAG: polysaccharide biosynthesis C-terminal domain-containing protein [Rhodobacteraceae bacterium]|nr:polysaccharide biosynthesis C-terminal domain-containing protein [Paracoccaceae bacterium]